MYRGLYLCAGAHGKYKKENTAAGYEMETSGQGYTAQNKSGVHV